MNRPDFDYMRNEDTKLMKECGMIGTAGRIRNLLNYARHLENKLEEKK